MIPQRPSVFFGQQATYELAVQSSKSYWYHSGDHYVPSSYDVGIQGTCRWDLAFHTYLEAFLSEQKRDLFLQVNRNAAALAVTMQHSLQKPDRMQRLTIFCVVFGECKMGGYREGEAAASAGWQLYENWDLIAALQQRFWVGGGGGWCRPLFTVWNTVSLWVAVIMEH